VSGELDVYKNLERFRKICIVAFSAIELAMFWYGIFTNEVPLAGCGAIALIVMSAFVNETLEQVCKHKLTFKWDAYVEVAAITVVATMATLLICLAAFLGLTTDYSSESALKWVVTSCFIFLIILLCIANLNSMLQELICNRKKEK